MNFCNLRWLELIRKLKEIIDNRFPHGHINTTCFMFSRKRLKSLTVNVVREMTRNYFHHFRSNEWLQLAYKYKELFFKFPSWQWILKDSVKAIYDSQKYRKKQKPSIFERQLLRRSTQIFFHSQSFGNFQGRNNKRENRINFINKKLIFLLSDHILWVHQSFLYPSEHLICVKNHGAN